MEPYTAEGMARRDAASEEIERELEDASQPLTGPVTAVSGVTSDMGPTIEVTISVPSEATQINYELVGVVVHSGQANAGHYYSFIKDRR